MFAIALTAQLAAAACAPVATLTGTDSAQLSAPEHVATGVAAPAIGERGPREVEGVRVALPDTPMSATVRAVRVEAQFAPRGIEGEMLSRRASPLRAPLLVGSGGWRTPDAPAVASLRGVRQSARDAWFATDKLHHFFMSFAATSFAYGAASSAGIEREPGLVIAGGSAIAAGFTKEWLDRARGGPFSVKDLAWDAAGIAAALLLLSGTR